MAQFHSPQCEITWTKVLRENQRFAFRSTSPWSFVSGLSLLLASSRPKASASFFLRLMLPNRQLLDWIGKRTKVYTNILPNFLIAFLTPLRRSEVRTFTTCRRILLRGNNNGNRRRAN